MVYYIATKIKYDDDFCWRIYFGKGKKSKEVEELRKILHEKDKMPCRKKAVIKGPDKTNYYHFYCNNLKLVNDIEYDLLHCTIQPHLFLKHVKEIKTVEVERK